MWNCPKCGEDIEDQFDACWKCAGGGTEEGDGEEPGVEEPFSVERRGTCPDCENELQPIKLLDATQGSGPDGAGSDHIEISFAAPDAKRSFFFGRTPRLGVVKGFICPGCGRILLYGVSPDGG